MEHERCTNKRTRQRFQREKIKNILGKNQKKKKRRRSFRLEFFSFSELRAKLEIVIEKVLTTRRDEPSNENEENDDVKREKFFEKQNENSI